MPTTNVEQLLPDGERQPIRGVVRNAAVAAQMRAFLARHGEQKAMQHFGLSRLSLARCAAGLGLHASTFRAVVAGLQRESELDTEVER